MINPFIKLTGCGMDEVLHVQVVNINWIVLIDGFTEVSLNGCTYIVKETPEKISAMIQEYYDHLMLSEYAKHGVQRDSRDTIIRADLAFDLAESMLKEFKERTSNV